MTIGKNSKNKFKYSVFSYIQRCSHRWHNCPNDNVEKHEILRMELQIDFVRVSEILKSPSSPTSRRMFKKSINSRTILETSLVFSIVFTTLKNTVNITTCIRMLTSFTRTRNNTKTHMFERLQLCTQWILKRSCNCNNPSYLTTS